MKVSYFSLGLALLPVAALAQSSGTTTSKDGAVIMTPRQIEAYNEGLASNDPYYIKCIRSQPTGSMIKKRECRTNADWSARAEAGNRDARDIADRARETQSSPD